MAGICQVCGSNIGFTRADDGFSYCDYCNSQADDIFDTGIDEEAFFSHYTNVSQHRTRRAVAGPTITPVKLTMSQFLDHPDVPDRLKIEDDMDNGVGPIEPTDFGSYHKDYSYEDYYSEIRSRYVMGFQVMIQLQSQALVEKFNVSPFVIGLVGPLWLRYLASTKIMANEWADQTIHESETQTQGEAKEFQPSANYRHKEPVNIHGKRVSYVWFRSLRSTLPISYSLAISLLVCHVAREPILPTDILKWALEGKLPYFAAFAAIEKQLGPCSKACPIRADHMFRPVKGISSQKLESIAAEIAQNIGLKLPHVNFYAIASRYLRQLSLPTEKLLPSACHIYEWSMPSELYLSANEARIPTRACVMSILVVAIRILFDINGYGMWESSLSSSSNSPSRVKNEDNIEPERSSSPIENSSDNDSFSHDSEPSGSRDSRLSVQELLKILDAKYYELADVHEYSCDLSAYLQYCKDVVFSGLNPSYEDVEEEKLIEDLWQFYQNNKGARTSDENETARLSITSGKSEDRHNGDEESARSSRTKKESQKEKAIKQLKLDMEEKQFSYIAPRVEDKIKSLGYLQYSRRKKDVLIYGVHADYYILLRCCAKIAQVETRIMHTAVLCLERRLQWLEKRIDNSLLIHSNLDDACEFCERDVLNAANDPIDFKI